MSACLGILAFLMVRRPKQVKAHLTDLGRYLYIGLVVGLTPGILFAIETDSQVTLTQRQNESATSRSRPYANRFNYARDMCHGTSLHPASVKAAFEPGKSQKADGLTNVLAGALLKNFVSDLGLGSIG